MGYFKGHKKVTKQQYQTLREGGSIVIGDKTVTYDEDTMYIVDDTEVPMLKVTQAQYETLLKGGTITIDGVEYTYDENTSYVTDEIAETTKVYKHDICFNFVGDITLQDGSYDSYSIMGAAAYLTLYTTSDTKFTKDTLDLSSLPIVASGYITSLEKTMAINAISSDATDTIVFAVLYYNNNLAVSKTSDIPVANITTFIDNVTEV